MQKWDYCYIWDTTEGEYLLHYCTPDEPEGIKVGSFSDTVVLLGEEGWEAVCAFGRRLLFKRLRP